MPLLLIGGSSFLASSYLSAFRPVSVATPFGVCQLSCNAERSIYFVQRHAANPAHTYSPPHLINHKAIMTAAKQLGVERIIAFGSVGSLKKSLNCGTLVVPDDHFAQVPITLFEYSKQGHVVPGFNTELRQELIDTLEAAQFQLVKSATYMQTIGPRFETPSEVRQLALIGEVVGMTCAHEATLALECEIPYALLCMCDNYANGVLNEKQLSTHDFHAGLKKNLSTMESVLQTVMQHFGKNATAASSSSLTQNKDETMQNGVSSVRDVDLIVSAAYIIQVQPATTLKQHSLVVHQGKIVDILPNNSAALSQYRASQTEHLPHSALMPGLVNAHTHVGMSMLRGYADDHCLHTWLTEHIWPAESQFLSPEFVECSTRLALAEMIRGGVTQLNDMYFFSETIAQVVKQSGMKATIGSVLMDFPSSYASGPDDYFAKGHALRQQYINDTQIQIAQAPHAPYTVSDEHLIKCGTIVAAESQHRNTAQFSGDRIHIHLHETQAECDASAQCDKTHMSCHRSDQKSRPLANLHRLGLLNQRLVAVHMTQLHDDEMDLIAKQRAHIVHCPSSNLKLASGVCPLDALLSRKINVALGTDSCASNNKLDLLGEARLAAILSKATALDASSCSAQQALEMATINGARALGREDQTGSLEKGKSADFIAMRIDDVIESIPLFDCVSSIIYSCDRSSITDVWCQGTRLMRSRALQTLDEEQIKTDVREWQTKLVAYHASKKRPRSDEMAVVLEAAIEESTKTKHTHK